MNPLSIYLKDYTLHLVQNERSSQTIGKYQRDIRSFLRFLPSGQPLSKESVLEYKQGLRDRYQISSANSMLVAVNSFLSFIGRPECRVKLFRLQRQSFRSRERELTRPEYARLVKAARCRKNERLALLLQTICGTGIRVSEHRFITVESLYSGTAQITNKGKTRTVFLPKELCRRLRQYCSKQRIVSGPVFATRSGAPMNRSNIWAEMKKLCQNAGVEPSKVFPHNLRHLFALTFYKLEKDIIRLADILGHSSVETTRIYTLTSPEEHIKALSRLHLLI